MQIRDHWSRQTDIFAFCVSCESLELILSLRYRQSFPPTILDKYLSMVCRNIYDEWFLSDGVVVVHICCFHQIVIWYLLPSFFLRSFFALNLNLIGSHEICHDVDSISLILSKSFSGKLKVTSEKFWQLANFFDHNFVVWRKFCQISFWTDRSILFLALILRSRVLKSGAGSGVDKSGSK